MRNALIAVLLVEEALGCGAAAAQQPVSDEKARVEGLLADKDTAGRTIRAYARLQQMLADYHGRRAEALAKAGNKDESAKDIKRANDELMLARQAYEAALQRYPENAELHNYYGELLFDRFGEEKEGVAEWRKAISLNDKLGNAYNNLGIYLCHAGDYSQGLENLDKALLLDPENPDYLYNIAQIYLTSWPQIMSIRKWSTEELYMAAMKASETAAKNAPEDYELVVDYARNFFVGEEMGLKPDWDSAAKAWQDARTLARNDDELFNTWLNEGRVWYRAGKGGKAVKCCEQALAIRPQSFAAKELLGMSRAPKMRKPFK